MTSQEVAKKFLLEMLDVDIFEYLDLVEWVEDQDFEADLYDEEYRKVWTALSGEIETMLSLYGDHITKN